jgi:hypothetical protein
MDSRHLWTLPDRKQGTMSSSFPSTITTSNFKPLTLTVGEFWKRYHKKTASSYSDESLKISKRYLIQKNDNERQKNDKFQNSVSRCHFFVTFVILCLSLSLNFISVSIFICTFLHHPCNSVTIINQNQNSFNVHFMPTWLIRRSNSS